MDEQSGYLFDVYEAEKKVINCMCSEVEQKNNPNEREKTVN